MTNEILKTFLEANSLKELTNAAGRALGCPLLVIDDSFHVAAYFRADSINDPYLGGVGRAAAFACGVPLQDIPAQLRRASHGLYAVYNA